MNITPLDDRILVKPLDAEETTAGGIVIPDTAQEKPQRGTIVAVGNGRLLDGGSRVAPSVKAGETVLFGKYAGSEVKVDGVEHTIMRESEILGVIEG